MDYNNLAIGVEERLDEIFADDLKGHNSQITKFQHFETPSLANLKSIIMSLEWEVTDDHLIDLMQEIKRLQKAYNKNHQLQKLLRLLFHLGRYIRIHKSHTHPYIFKMLFRVYNGSAKIASGNYSNHGNAKIVNDEIKHYFSLKAYLKRENINISRPSLKKVNTLEKNRLSPIDSFSKESIYQTKDLDKIHSRNLNNDLKELKKFIYLEIKKLREDLQGILALIHK
jgi:hypothetical protein